MNGFARRSPLSTNTTRAARPSTAPTAGTHGGTPGCGAAVTAVMSRATPTVRDPAPAQSMRACWPLSRGTTRRVRTRTPIVTGIRAPKIARQPNASAMNPPTGGPIAWPMPLAAPQAPITLLRRSGGKVRARVPMTATGTAARPRPCSARLITIGVSEGAIVAPIVPRSSTPRAMTRVRRRPSRSLTQPVSGIATASTRTEAEAISTPWVTGTPKSAVIWRRGTLTMLLLMVPSTVAPSRAASSHARCGGGGDSGGDEFGGAAGEGRADPVVVSGTVVLSLLLPMEASHPGPARPTACCTFVSDPTVHIAHGRALADQAPLPNITSGSPVYGATMQLTAAHWVFLAGVVVILAAMIMRKNIVVPAVVATFLTALVYTGSLADRSLVGRSTPASWPRRASSASS